MPAVGTTARPPSEERKTKVIRYLWQLPQHLLGLLLVAVLRGRVAERRRAGEQVIHYCFRAVGGISLGRYVFVHREANDALVRHEMGHCRQSLLLGPLYLLVVGLPSFLWAGLYSILRLRRPGLDYFRFYTESWANRLSYGGGGRSFGRDERNRRRPADGR